MREKWRSHERRSQCRAGAENYCHADRRWRNRKCQCATGIETYSPCEELGNTDLVERLLKHAESTAADELESGWVKFETLRNASSSVDEFVELAAMAEKMAAGKPLGQQLSFITWDYCT